jgi:hypothetical protein
MTTSDLPRSGRHLDGAVAWVPTFITVECLVHQSTSCDLVEVSRLKGVLAGETQADPCLCAAADHDACLQVWLILSG